MSITINGHSVRTRNEAVDRGESRLVGDLGEIVVVVVVVVVGVVVDVTAMVGVFISMAGLGV
jgi:hypothetical protein